MIEYSSTCEAETNILGARLAAAFEPGLVVALVGDLGAGKTHLVRAIATALGVDPDDVGSPTFVLVREYDARASDGEPLPLYHFDAYRLADVDEFLELGADEMLHGDGVCLVEWADRVAEVLPGDMLRIVIEHVGDRERRFRIVGETGRAARVVERMRRLDG